jgi:hypothetical protein
MKPMQQTNVLRFPVQVPEAERMRLFRDDPCTILSLAAFRARAPHFKRPSLG